MEQTRAAAFAHTSGGRILAGRDLAMILYL
jgi:hypothetical protein